MSQGEKDAAPPPSDAEERKRKRREARRRRVRRLRAVRTWTFRLAVLVFLSAGALTFFLLQTEAGHRVALDFALDQVRSVFAGELRVGSVRARTLLSGATLEDVVLTDASGRRMLSSDSVVVRYLPTGLFTSAPRFRSVIFWGLDLEISRLSESDDLNLARILAERPPTPDSATTRLDLVFGQIGVRGGRVSVLSPATEGRAAGALGVVAGPLGPLDRLGLDAMDLDLDDAVLTFDRDVLFTSDLASLAMRVSTPGSGEPMVVREAFGRVAFDLERGLRLTEGAFRLPETLGRGTVVLAPSSDGEGWALAADLRVEDWGSLGDLRWADARIPDGTFRGGAEVSTGERLTLVMDQVDIRLSDSNLALDGEISFGATMAFRELDVTASPLGLSRFSPWLERDLPVDGWLSGRATLSGSFEDLSASGRMTFVPVGFGGYPTTADFSGRMHLGTDLGWSGLEARLDPVNWAVTQALAPDVPFEGRGTANVQLDGRVRNGVRVVADLVHQPRGSSAVSRAFVRGMVIREGDAWSLDLSGDVVPLSLAALDAVAPDLDLRGEVRGPWSARGPLTALVLTTDLEGVGGRVRGEAVLDLVDSASGYRLSLEAERMSLASITGRVPDPTDWNGTLEIEGTGFDLEAFAGRASVRLLDSRIGGLTIDTVTSEFHAEQGVLFAEDLVGSVGGIHFEGDGQLGLRADASGQARLAFSSESLIGLRPLLMGDSILVGDDLSSLDRELLRLQGIEPDTLPSAEDVRMTGAVEGVADLSGHLTDLAVSLHLTLVNGALGADQVDSLDAELQVQGLPSTRGRWDVDMGAVGLVWAGRSFEEVSIQGSMRDRDGDGTVSVRRRATESYTVSGEFALDSVGGSARVEEASASLDGRIWDLVFPTTLSWTGGALTVDSLEVHRAGLDPMTLVAAGTLAREGASDFTLNVDGLHLEQIGSMVREEPLDVAGHVDLALHVRGPAREPLIDAELEVLDPRFRNMALTRLAGTLVYRDRETTISLNAWEGERRALTASGTVPVDLALAEIETRRVDAPMDLSMTADSLDAALALAYFGTLENVVGVLSADVRIGGTTEDPVPTGSARLEGGAWTIEALGVRHRDVTGTLELQADRTVVVDLSTRGTGVSTVTGTVGFSRLTDPSLDLRVTFDRFRAMERRDIEGTVSGEFTLRGAYQRPLAEGSLIVDEGTLLVDEFSRAVGVVDLSDPRLFGQGLAVDTTVFMSQPILADVRNPFLDNLRLNVDLLVPRNTWLRSNDMNVEMGGQLLVRYDRSASDLVLIGELEALRGTYLVLGRTFEVEEGTLSFIGRPGVNPTLNITALSRIRPPGTDPVVITATVEGTLVQPRVTLTSEDGALSQSDLISYLVFNQSAAELGRSQQTFLTGQVNPAISTAVSGGVTYLAGAFFNQSGAALAQNFGLDYLSISAGPGSFVGMGLSATQLEAGRYLSDDVFVVVVLRPLAGQDTGYLGGVRVEWALTNAYNVEAFIEDRFLRAGSGLVGLQDLEGQQIYGVLFFREWGYNE